MDILKSFENLHLLVRGIDPEKIEVENIFKNCILKSNSSEDFYKSWSSDLKQKFPNGHWATINGSRVFINGGKIVAGLDNINKMIDEHFEGKGESETIKNRYNKAISNLENELYTPLSAQIKTSKGVSYPINVTVEKPKRDFDEFKIKVDVNGTTKEIKSAKQKDGSFTKFVTLSKEEIGKVFGMNVSGDSNVIIDDKNGAIDAKKKQINSFKENLNELARSEFEEHLSDNSSISLKLTYGSSIGSGYRVVSGGDTLTGNAKRLVTLGSFDGIKGESKKDEDYSGFVIETTVSKLAKEMKTLTDKKRENDSHVKELTDKAKKTNTNQALFSYQKSSKDGDRIEVTEYITPNGGRISKEVNLDDM